MKKVAMFLLMVAHYSWGNSENPKKEENIGKQVYEAGKQDVIDSLSNLNKEIKDSGIYEQAAKVGKAIDEFAHEYPWIVPGTMVISTILIGKKALIIAAPFIAVGVYMNITQEKKKENKEEL